jgi:hypothetical protein
MHNTWLNAVSVLPGKQFQRIQGAKQLQNVSLTAVRVCAVIQGLLCRVTSTGSMSANGDIQNPCQIIQLPTLSACGARLLSFERDNKLCANGYGDALNRHK